MALSVACEHLSGVVSQIKVNGEALPEDLKLISSKDQVGDSESVWEAVSLYNQIREILARKTMSR